MRLIDADKLKETLLKFNYTTAHNQIFRYIDEQPTAFDTEKVIEQLEEMKNNKDCQVYCYEFYKKKCMIHENAIDIVKKGGVE